MGIVIVREPAMPSQIVEMSAEFGSVIKLAVDLEREILAGGELHALALQSPALCQQFEAIVRRLLEVA